MNYLKYILPLICFIQVLFSCEVNKDLEKKTTKHMESSVEKSDEFYKSLLDSNYNNIWSINPKFILKEDYKTLKKKLVYFTSLNPASISNEIRQILDSSAYSTIKEDYELYILYLDVNYAPSGSIMTLADANKGAFKKYLTNRIVEPEVLLILGPDNNMVKEPLYLLRIEDSILQDTIISFIN